MASDVQTIPGQPGQEDALTIAMLMWACTPAREGGAERQCRRLTVELTRMGMQCLIVTSWPAKDVPTRQVWEGGTIIRMGSLVPALTRVLERIRRQFRTCPSKALAFWAELPFTWLCRRSFLRGFNQWLRTEEAAHVHVVQAHEATWMAGLAAESAGPGRVALGKATLENPLLPLGYDVPSRTKFSRLRLMAAYVAPAGYLKEQLVQRGIPPGRVFTIPNGVDMPHAAASRSNRQDVLYVGNLSQGADHKAFDVLFDAWARVSVTHPDARLNVLGGGDPHYWVGYVDRRGCSGSVRFVGYQSDPASWFNGAGCFVLPSRKEGMSNALLEAQAWGLPCVLSDIAANRAVARDGETALFVPVGDAGALADGIVRLLTDDVLCSRLGMAARLNAAARFDIRVTAGHWLKAYRHLLETDRAGS